MKQEIRILIADDHPLMRQGLRQAYAEREEENGYGKGAQKKQGRAALVTIQLFERGVARLCLCLRGVLCGFCSHQKQ